MDEATETVAGWLGSRQPRELMPATIFAGMAVKVFEDAIAKNGKGGDDLHKLVGTSVQWADSIIKYCKEHPPT